jgi:hypothetical protein
VDVYVDGVQSTNVNLESNPQTDVTIIGDPQTSVDVAEEEKIGIEVEQDEPVDVKIDGQIYEVGNPIPGQDGFSPIVEVEEIEGGHRVTITDVEGTKVFDVLNGQNGEDGYTPQKGVDYFDGKDGQDGRDGVDGYTPIKGVDYFTDSDKKEIAQEISSIYDVDGNGQVDKADDSDRLGGQLPSHYAKVGDIPSVPTKVSAFDNDAGYLTKHQSLENYPTKQEVAEGLNKKQDSLERFVESVNGYSGQVNLSAGDVHALPESTVIPTVPSVVSAFVNDADYASKTYVAEVAAGKCKAYTFSTVDELDLWLGNEENTSKLNNGDVFYIRAVGVPDYWWDGETQSKQILETTKVDLTDYAKSTDIPTKVSQLNNDAKYTTESEVDTKLGGKQDKLTSYVSSVNGKSGAVSLNATDVGALPDNTVIPTVPTKVSAFQNDAGYLTQHQDLSAYAKKTDIPSIPSSLPANGGNADTVDNKHASDFAQVGTSNQFNGEQKFVNSQYAPSVTDSASGVGCAFKSSRGLFNEALIDKVIMTSSTGKIPFYKYTGTSGGSMSGLTQVSYIDTNGTYQGSATKWNGYQLRTASSGDTGKAGYITFVV